jgi:hypothetical protein
MKAGNWAGLAVLFLLPSCLFPPLLIGVLVCLIGMVIAIQQGPPKSVAGVNTQAGFVQATTNAHWSSFERMTGDYSGVFRVFLSDKHEDDRRSLLNTIRIGEPLAVVPLREQNARGATVDYFAVKTMGGRVVGRLPEALAYRYVQAMKTQGAAFTGKVYQIVNDTKEPVVLAEFRRCDLAHLENSSRSQFWTKYGVYFKVAALFVGAFAAIMLVIAN